MRGWDEAILSGREGTAGTASDEEVVEGTVVVGNVGAEVGVGSMRAAMPPARSQGFGGEPIKVLVL